MGKYRVYIIFGLCLLWAAFVEARAEDMLDLTLENCIELGIKNNLGIKKFRDGIQLVLVVIIFVKQVAQLYKS